MNTGTLTLSTYGWAARANASSPSVSSSWLSPEIRVLPLIRISMAIRSP